MNTPTGMGSFVVATASGEPFDDLREAVTTLEELERTARRVLGGASPLTTCFGDDLREARTLLRARETEA